MVSKAEKTQPVAWDNVMVGCIRQKHWYVLFRNALGVTREETEVLYVLVLYLYKDKCFFVVEKKKN